MAKKQDTISIGFEEKIWKAADILRGNLSASQYEGVVLGLIFLKYISDRFEQKFKELQGDEYADPEDKDEYTADNIFFVPQEARWSKISAAAHTPEIGVVIDDALAAIERENEKLKGVLPKNFARPELDKRRLGDVVDLLQTSRCTMQATRKTCWAEPTNTVCASLPRWKARMVASSTLLRASFVHWLRFSNPMRAESMTLAAEAVVCLYRAPNSLSATRETCAR